MKKKDKDEICKLMTYNGTFCRSQKFTIFIPKCDFVRLEVLL